MKFVPACELCTLYTRHSVSRASRLDASHFLMRAQNRPLHFPLSVARELSRSTRPFFCSRNGPENRLIWMRGVLAMGRGGVLVPRGEESAARSWLRNTSRRAKISRRVYIPPPSPSLAGRATFPLLHMHEPRITIGETIIRKSIIKASLVSNCRLFGVGRFFQWSFIDRLSVGK